MSPEKRATAEALLSSPRQSLSEHNAKKLLESCGIRTTLERRASTVEEALVAAREIGYPVVLKVESSSILHKTEAGALRTDIRDDGMLRLAYDEILRNAREYAASADLEGVLVQETVTGGVEVIVGVTQDPQLGPVLLYGLGGILVELMSDVSLRMGIIVNFSRGPAFRPHRDIRGIARLCTASPGSRPPARRPRSDRCGS